MTTGLSAASMETLAGQVEEYLHGSILKAGGVVDALLGVDANGNPSFAVIPEGVGELELPLEVLKIPGSFQQFEESSRSAFADRGIQAALFWGEAWSFPPVDEETLARYVAEGLHPSQHPERQEVIFLSAHWPRGGVGWLSTWQILRAATGNSLAPLIERSVDESVGSRSYVTTWVDDVLPRPRLRE